MTGDQPGRKIDEVYGVLKVYAADQSYVRLYFSSQLVARDLAPPV